MDRVQHFTRGNSIAGAFAVRVPCVNAVTNPLASDPGICAKIVVDARSSYSCGLSIWWALEHRRAFRLLDTTWQQERPW